MAASAPATSSLKFDGVFLQLVEGHDLQRYRMGRLENDLRRLAGVQRLLPASGAQAPTVAGLQPGEAELGHRRRQVVALALREGEELGGHDDANRVQAHVLAAGIAAGVAIE